MAEGSFNEVRIFVGSGVKQRSEATPNNHDRIKRPPVFTFLHVSLAQKYFNTFKEGDNY